MITREPLVGEGVLQPVRLHAEPVVHFTVDQDDRDVLRPPRHQVAVVADVLPGPLDPERGTHGRHNLDGVRAQVAAGLEVDDDPRGLATHALSRSRPLATFPIAECGSSTTISTDVGHLNRASRRAAYSMMSSAVGVASATGTTNAFTVSPVYGCGIPITATSATAG